MAETVSILGVKVNKVNMEEALSKVASFIEEEQGSHLVVTPNSEMIVMAGDDPELAMILNGADLSVPDGAGVVLASRVLNDPVPERVAGFDLMKELFKIALFKKYTIYLLGGKPGIVEKARDNLLNKMPQLKICGVHHGYLDKELQQKVMEEINELKPDLLFVGMGVPLQEKFLHKNLSKLDVEVAMTVGGAFDVLAGEIKRAPLWMQRSGLEWLFRLLQEPKRFWRMLALPRFIIQVLYHKFIS